MKDEKGKVILSLLAGATAGIVAGLLLAPETGDKARAGLRQVAGKWGAGLRNLLGSAPQSASGPAADHHGHRASADRLLASLGAETYDDTNPDYDGDGGDGRHRAVR